MKTLAFLLLVAAAAAAAPGWTLIGWNDLGMHCMDGDYTVFSILPPYNTIHAQLIDPNGRLVRGAAGVSVTYEAVRDSAGSINSTSAWKTRFWEFARALFGAAPAPDAGLAGSNMPGPGNRAQPMKFESEHNWFTAEGIPITAWDDAGNYNPYPLMRLTARDNSGAVLATTDIVLPVSDEMNCRACHASGARPETQPSRGWANAASIEREYKLNILALHDDRARSIAAFGAALRATGYGEAGLRASADNGTPVLCGSCHSTNALGTKGQPGAPPLTAAVHRFHARIVDRASGLSLDSDQNRGACYRCHPGAETRCLRGAMGGAVAADGSMAMQCQSCHGSMSAVGAARTGWLDQPNCQACHTGTAVRNTGQIRYTSVFASAGTLRTPADDRFATNANTPAPGISLYRFSHGHGGVACEACHGPTHAEYPSTHDNDNVQNIRLQGHAGTIGECAACHSSITNRANGGPHGMHAVGQDWVRLHHEDDYAERNRAQCRECHGEDYRGTVLSRSLAARTVNAFGTKQFWRGFQIGCYTCHRGPDSDDASRNAAPVATSAAASTAAATPVQFGLQAVDPDGAPPPVRIVTQPRNGTAALSGAVVTYTPFAGFEGDDTLTWAAGDGFTDSNLATVTISVRAPARPAFTAGGVVNAASFRGGGVSPGEMVTIFGAGLGPEPIAHLWLNSASLLARSTGGTRVLFDGAPAPLIHATATQVTVLVPYAVADRGSTGVQVEYNGIRSAAVGVPVVAAVPGLFAANMRGEGPGAVLNQDGRTANSAEAPAPRGSVVSLFATGEGLTDREWIDGQLASGALAKPRLPVTVRIGGVDAAVEYAGSAPGNTTGFLQVNVRVPDGVTPGSAVPVTLRIGSAESQPGVTIAVR